MALPLYVYSVTAEHGFWYRGIQVPHGAKLLSTKRAAKYLVLAGIIEPVLDDDGGSDPATMIVLGLL